MEDKKEEEGPKRKEFYEGQEKKDWGDKPTEDWLNNWGKNNNFRDIIMSDTCAIIGTDFGGKNDLVASRIVDWKPEPETKDDAPFFLSGFLYNNLKIWNKENAMKFREILINYPKIMLAHNNIVPILNKYPEIDCENFEKCFVEFKPRKNINSDDGTWKEVYDIIDKNNHIWLEDLGVWLHKGYKISGDGFLEKR